MRFVNHILVSAVFALCAMTTTSCLEKLPEDSILDTKAMTTLSDANQIVNGVYAGLRSSVLYNGNLTLLPDIQCDMVYAVQGNTNTYGNFWRWEVLASTKEIEDVYAALYVVIGRCNFFLAYVERVRNSLIDDVQLDALQELEGDVYFARALAYSELVKMYCKAYDPATAADDLGVVLADSYYNPGRAKRASLEDSYKFILDDLEKAAQYVIRPPAGNPGANITGYVSKFTPAAVDALYARVYLYMRNWPDAERYATKVIENEYGVSDTAYPTLSSVNERLQGRAISDYETVWQYDEGSELIWRVRLLPQDAYSAGRLGDVFLHYNSVTFKPDYVVSEAVLNSYIAGDLRKGIFFRNFGAEDIGYAYNLTQPLVVKYYGNMDFVDGLRIWGVSMAKPLRISEQYLIRAEAKAQQGNYSGAQTDLATMRSARFSSGGNIVINSGNWLEEISKERVRELFMEGHRLHDLKRWGAQFKGTENEKLGGFERKPQTNSIKEGSSLKIEPNDPRFVWPIPQHEIDSPGAEIVQN